MGISLSRAVAGAAALVLGVTTLGVPPAAAVNADHGNRVVSANPADNTPHAMNGSVNALVQVGNKIIAAGTFTRVSPAATFSNTGDDLVRNRIFAFDATTGVIDPSFDPNLGGAVNSLATDGTSVYVAGSFGSTGGNTTYRRLVKLTDTGQLVTTFRPNPNRTVDEVVFNDATGRLYAGGAFSNIGGAARERLAALDPTTGAALAGVNLPFAGRYNGGTTTIKRFDVSPDGSTLVAVGNFTTVAGQPRVQFVKIDTNIATNGVATVSGWSTDRFGYNGTNNCAGVFDTFMRDVDFAPNGSYFVVSTTGAFAGGANSGTLCDTITRWETNQSGNDPTWSDYTGGDTSYGVAVTGSAVYVGGHMRWMNNPFQGDQAGPGAVPRDGIVALDPDNGLPLSWNPGRTRGVGAQALLATSQGLWVGSDTTKIARETHGRIAFMPLAGGTTVPAVAPATLPNNLFLAQRATAAGSNVLFRVNAGGPPIQAADNGPDWEVDDPYRNTGNSADWGGAAPVDGTVPAGTPSAVFATERWDDGGDPEMAFDFPVASGQSVRVRLYFADRCDCTADPGSRVFDVSVEGQLRLDDFDINAAAGHGIGTMREFTVTSDGTIDIDFGHVVENPLVNAIEIVSAPGGGGTATPAALLRRPVDASGSPTGPATTANTGMDWSLVRGAFYLNGTVYYGLGNGNLHWRTFNPATGALGAQNTVNLYDDPDTGERIPFAISNLTGMFYDTATHRIYYTVFGDSRLFYRYFTPESRIVGAQTFVADGGGVDFSSVAGMTLASGRLLYGSRADGSLRSVGFSGGRVTGGPTVLSSDGSWNPRAMFVPN